MNVEIEKALVPNRYAIKSGDSENIVTHLQLIAIMRNVCREPFYFQIADIKMLLDEEVKLSLESAPELKDRSPELIFPEQEIEVWYPVIVVPYLLSYKFRNHLTFRYGLKGKMFKQAYFEVEASLNRANKSQPHIISGRIVTVDYKFTTLN